ncbi:MAG: GNAT family N-acetyltransferase [Nakamurella sp.]
MTVRPARADEYAQVGDLTVRAYAADNSMGNEGYAARLRDAEHRAEQAELLVAEVDGHLVGTVTFVGFGGEYADVARPGEAEFRMLAVAPEARKRSVATTLVRACIRRANELGGTPSWLAPWTTRALRGACTRNWVSSVTPNAIGSLYRASTYSAIE